MEGIQAEQAVSKGDDRVYNRVWSLPSEEAGSREKSGSSLFEGMNC
jgi:hypothetical protein